MLAFSRLLALGLLGLHSTWAAEPLQPVRMEDAPAAEFKGGPDPSKSPVKLNVDVSTSFPQAEIFGVKLVNGLPTTAVVTFTNKEPTHITVGMIGGSLWTPASPGLPSKMFRNLTTIVYNAKVPVGATESFNFIFTTDMHPQDLRLALASILLDGNEMVHTLPAYNETVSVVEAPTSILDPQVLFLYIVLIAAFAGTAYFVYSTWYTTIFPQQKKRGGGKGAGDRSKTPTKGSKKGESSAQDAAAGVQGTTVSSGGKTYDESWIPAHHMQKPGAKKIRGGTPSGAKTKARPA